jgi:adenine/guanine phosphoribosyltransferase-like PRPP-binding protein
MTKVYRRIHEKPLNVRLKKFKQDYHHRNQRKEEQPMNLHDLLQLKPADFQNRDVPVEEILSWFDACDAYWIHDGQPSSPHAELTSGMCSNGFFDCLRVLKYVSLSEILANQMARKIKAVIGDQKVDWVIASPMAGITFGYDIARALGAPIFMFTEKDSDQKGKMLWKRMTIPEGETVLQIEELTTTSKTLNAVREAVDSGNSNPVNWLPYIGIFVHRPPKLPVNQYGDRRVIALIEKEVWAVDPSECSLCKNGSVRYRPKTHWKELTGKV